MPPKLCATSASTSTMPAWRRCSASGPSSLPPPHICATINAQVISNPALARTEFDFAGHVKSRSYSMQNFVFGDCEAAVLLDEGVESLLPKTFQPPCPTPLYTFEIGDAGDKGLGMFVLRDTPAGSLILVEHPIIVAPYLLGLSLPLADVYAELSDRLPPDTRYELMHLANSYSTKEYSFLEGIVRTNALGIQLEVSSGPHPEIDTHRAVFLNTSRCNHSCGPNARWEWDVKTFSLYLSAVRPIRKGEEVTIQYVSSTRPRHERGATLEALCGFLCQCPYCRLPSGDAVHFSDSTRAALEQFWDTLPPYEKWCLDASMPDDALIKLHVEALRMIKQEGLQVLGGEKHVDAIAMCYGALADVEMFKAWTERVRDAKVQANPAQALVFAKWLSNPTSFPTWGWKKTFCRAKKDLSM